MSVFPVVAFTFLIAVPLPASAQTPPPQPAGTDLYHVHLTKAVPGQAAALGKALMQPDPSEPMPDHFVVLRHQEGDDWDYAVIQHLGPTAKVALVTTPPPSVDLSAWHTDTFVSGPSWAEFTKQMGIGGAGVAGAVYTLGMHRAVPGHRDQLRTALAAPATSKVQTGNVLMQHREGGDWTFLAITRYNSWQDLATDRGAAAAGTGDGWSEIRQHSAFHRDTLADRIHPAK
jgi:hypothetical protein